MQKNMCNLPQKWVVLKAGLVQKPRQPQKKHLRRPKQPIALFRTKSATVKAFPVEGILPPPHGPWFACMGHLIGSTFSPNWHQKWAHFQVHFHNIHQKKVSCGGEHVAKQCALTGARMCAPDNQSLICKLNPGRNRQPP